jgi:hypothetical protein
VRARLLVTLAFGLASCGLMSGAKAAEKGTMAMEKVEYRGWKNNLRLSNGDVELIITLDVGPRILSYHFAGGKNVFKEYDEQMGRSGESEWMIRGGHRLWAAPEDPARTYALDNGPATFEELGTGAVRVRPAPETPFGLQKELDIRLTSKGSEVTVTHRIKNIGREGTNLAPWSLSVMAPGGVEIIPSPPQGKHPGAAKNASSPADFAPNRLMALWPYTDLKDPRWDFGNRFIKLRQDTRKGPTKLGLLQRLGIVAYLNGGTAFLKRFDYVEGSHYPDGGCNFETFTNEDMLEIESLGPLTRLEPGKAIEHVERWELLPARSEHDLEVRLTAKR